MVAAQPIRTLTYGLDTPHPLPTTAINQAAIFLKEAQKQYQDAGYEVQTVRLSTRPLFSDLATWADHDILHYVRELHYALAAARIQYCSLGPAPAHDPAFPLERLEIMVDILNRAPSCSATVQIASRQHGLRAEAAQAVAHITQRLAQETRNGDGNFRFAMLACVEPGTPFFPAAYHQGPASITLGLQGASLLMEAWQNYESQAAFSPDPRLLTQLLQEVLTQKATPLIAIAQKIARQAGITFSGIDLSPAPMGEDSIVLPLELFLGGPLGSSGTVNIVAAITAALKGTTLPTCGYCGLMLPVLEDALLGKRWEEGHINIHQLLLYSSICGTGLDTIPLAGDTALDKIAGLFLDVATLAVRLQKPLSARLFPVPGRQAGERTTFESPYLTNTIVK